MTVIVLDFDGPLFDGRKAMWRALEQTRDDLQPRLQIVLPPESTLPLLPPAPLIGLLCASLPDADRALVTETYQRYLKRAEAEQRLSDEVVRTLMDLHERGYTMALFSGRSADGLAELVRRFGIESMFVKPPDGAAAAPKPSGEYLRRLRETVGAAQGGDMVVVGDSDLDCLAAEDAKVPYYHAGWTGEPASQAPRKAVLTISSIAELRSIFVRNAVVSAPSDEADLYAAVRQDEFCLYAGAGVSSPSGIGDWQRHYRPVLERLGASYLCKDTSLIEVLQLLCAEPQRARKVFDEFRKSFEQLKSPNAYHYALLRAHPVRIWTSNYDRLFERAVDQCGFDRIVVNNDTELLQNFGARMLVKMNGDFREATFDENLDWNVVFLQEQFDRAEVQRPEIWRLFEDDYRNRCIVFVGVSFTDPALRRVVSVARRRIPRTRYTHYLLQKRLTDPAARNQQAMFAENLRRASIVTIFKDTHEEIEAIIREIGVRSNRPIVGFSGNGGRVSPQDDVRSLTAAGMAMPCGQIEDVCARMGREIARRGNRVSSGCAQFVGIPAVEAAFDQDPTSARFYLRRKGGVLYQRSAPALVVSGDTYAEMRRRFIPELSFLIGIGGQPHGKAASGTLTEIQMALDLGIPVLLLPQAGGTVAERWPELRQRMSTAYSDSRLRTTVCELNDRVKAWSSEQLLQAASSELVSWVQGVLSTAMGAQTRDTDCAAFRERQEW